MNVQRWTLVVVCAATAMLMLDIAVVNTALSRIAEDLDTGLSGLQWVVDAYTLALASDRADRRRARRPPRPPAAVHRRPRHLHRRFSRLRPRPGHRDAQLRARRPGHRRRDHVRRLARAARPRVPGRPRARRRARRVRRHDRRLVRGRPARRRRCSPAGSTGSGSSSSTCPIGVACLWITRTYVEESRDPNAARDRLARPDHADRRPVPARPRAPARQRGRLDVDADRRRAGRRRRRARRVRGRRAARRGSRCCRCGCSADATFTGAQVAAFAHLGLVLRAVPLRDALPAADPRAVRRSRPASSTCRARSSCSSSPARPRSWATRCRPRTMIAGGLGAGRRRPRPVHARRRDLVVDDRCCRACSSPASAPASSTRRSPTSP